MRCMDGAYLGAILDSPTGLANTGPSLRSTDGGLATDIETWFAGRVGLPNDTEDWQLVAASADPR